MATNTEQTVRRLYDVDGFALHGSLYVPDYTSPGPGHVARLGVGPKQDGQANQFAHEAVAGTADPTNQVFSVGWASGAASGSAVCTCTAPGTGLRLYLVAAVLVELTGTSQHCYVSFGNLGASLFFLQGINTTTAMIFQPLVIPGGSPTTATNLSITGTVNFESLAGVAQTATGNGQLYLWTSTRPG